MQKYQTILQKVDLLAEPLVFYQCSNGPWRQLYSHIHWIRSGNTSSKSLIQLARIFLLILASYLLTPLALILHILGYRFFSVDLKQIGSLLWLDSFVRQDRLRGRNTPKEKIFVTRSTFTDANPYSLNLYKQYFTFISNPFLKLLIAPFFMNQFFTIRATEFEQLTDPEVEENTRWSFSQENYHNFHKKYNFHLVKLSEDEVLKAQSELAELIPPKAKFVALHVRDAGFYGDKTRQTRGADINTYEKAIRHLIKEGFYVVRIGHPSADSIIDMKSRLGDKLVDYACSGIRSDFLDCYLTSKCSFFIGCSSGPSVLPDIFGVPSCNVNVYTVATATLFLEQNLATFKKIRAKDTGELLPFENMVKQPFDRNLQEESLNKLGFELVNNSPDEILGAVREFLESKNSRPSKIQSYAKSKLKPYNYSYGCSGNFSNTILRLYDIKP
ncbi:hypothetical protein HIMB100_00022930 [SAR116 cluster alpha proteobacterium HIMB100]|nr:hypothetical protein HIMB100_00022930 [SAR116 cluster alpha proteobacterium HIMB100]